MENQQIDEGAVNLAKAIRQNESGGQMIKGKSGEYGAYQFTPDTWKATAPKYGFNVPLEESTLEQQNAVAYHRIKEWKDSGKDVTQIASMWNAGEGEPDAYKGTFSNGKASIGVNKFGVRYDVPAYAKNIATTYAELKNGGQGINTNNPSYAGDKNVGVLGTNPEQSLAGNVANNSITRGAGGLVNKFIKPWVDVAAIPMQAGIAGYNALTGSNVKDPYANLESLGEELPVSSLGDIKGKAKSGLQVGGQVLAATTAGLLGKFFGGAKIMKNPVVTEALDEVLPSITGKSLSQIMSGQLTKAEIADGLEMALRNAPVSKRAILEKAFEFAKRDAGLAPGLLKKTLGWGARKTGQSVKELLKLGIVGAGIGTSSGLVRNVVEGPQVNQ